MPAWKKLTGSVGSVRYHIYGTEENLDSDFIDKIVITEADGNEIVITYNVEGILIINYNGNRVWFHTPAPAFTYASYLEQYSTAEELITAVKNEISYLLSSVLS